MLRNTPLQKNDDSFKGLMAAFDEAGFQFRTRLVPQPMKDGVRQPAMMEQIVFFHPTQKDLAQRFISEFTILINGTFQAQKWQLELLTPSSKRLKW